MEHYGRDSSLTQPHAKSSPLQKSQRISNDPAVHGKSRVLHSAHAQTAAWDSSRAGSPAAPNGARLNCPKCNAKLVPKPVLGAIRFPQRLECPEHGWLKERVKLIRMRFHKDAPNW